MNTPRSKSPKRFTQTIVAGRFVPPDGHYRSGIYNQAISSALGELAADWPHVEEAMIDVLASLLGNIEEAPARQVFHAIINAKIRIDVMRTLLESAELNEHKGEWFDEVLDEFKSLNSERNAYIHGLWYTHDSGKVFLAQPSVSDLGVFSPQREISSEELTAVAVRMNELFRKVTFGLDDEDVRGSSPQKPPQPRT